MDCLHLMGLRTRGCGIVVADGWEVQTDQMINDKFARVCGRLAMCSRLAVCRIRSQASPRRRNTSIAELSRLAIAHFLAGGA